MSEVKRYHFESFIDSYYKHRQFVLASDYDTLAAEAQALREEVAQQKFLTKVENDALKMMTDKANELKSEVEQLEEELESLRARVVVAPERKLLNAGVPGLNRNSGWNDCLDELARLNGRAVSEGLLRSACSSITRLILSAQTRPSCQKGMVDPCRCHRCNVDRALKVDAELRALLSKQA